MTAEVRPQLEKESQIIWKTTDVLWEIDWFRLKHEFVHWQAPWKVFSMGTFIKCSFIAFVMLVLSSIDVGSDVALAYEYLHGAKYAYYFSNYTDPRINEMNCTYLRNASYGSEGGLLVYSCFKREKISGILTLIFTFVPGFLFSFFCAYGLWTYPTKVYSWCFIIFSPFFVAIFPFMMITFKVIKTFLICSLLPD